mmetsp:Transcript_25500/g.58848  ORF Transcript_25500/g.58848 Transcript_25500/m.58848 type:complete len:211 (-) Transcript_25500:1554-2186(-)
MSTWSASTTVSAGESSKESGSSKSSSSGAACGLNAGEGPTEAMKPRVLPAVSSTKSTFQPSSSCSSSCSSCSSWVGSSADSALCCWAGTSAAGCSLCGAGMSAPKCSKNLLSSSLSASKANLPPACSHACAGTCELSSQDRYINLRKILELCNPKGSNGYTTPLPASLTIGSRNGDLDSFGGSSHALSFGRSGSIDLQNLSATLGSINPK